MEKIMQFLNYCVIYWLLLVCMVIGSLVGLVAWGVFPAIYSLLATFEFIKKEEFSISYVTVIKNYIAHFWRFLTKHPLVTGVGGVIVLLLIIEIYVIPSNFFFGRFMIGPILVIGLYFSLAAFLTLCKLTQFGEACKVIVYDLLLPLIYWKTSLGVSLMLFSSVVFAGVIKISVLYFLPVVCLLGKMFFEK